MSLPTITVGKGETAVKIEQTAALAPMASIADTAYRRICKEYGASYVVGELASAKGISYGDDNSRILLKVRDYERPMAVQLFGSEPEFMVKAAQIAMEYHLPVLARLPINPEVAKLMDQGEAELLPTEELAVAVETLINM